MNTLIVIHNATLMIGKYKEIEKKHDLYHSDICMTFEVDILK